jgi:putative PIN family toxin of toxin-antitoxin system
MRVVLDANILLSALLFPKSAVAELVGKIADKREMVLSNTIIDEATAVVTKKFPAKIGVWEDFLAGITYEYQYVPESYLQSCTAEISDPKDKHVLATAFFAQADVIVTGDKHFFERTYEGIKILHPSEIADKY